ncbi:hypothetical protein C1H46_035589 [Malus baccata]|uniref:Glycosyltransferase n=1 Tax=Malus baccata TaxID=106549 RepID=A0A540KXC0_MALBA|nr:hypothetical protein C1H46_035589 [Malus baccata]
MTSRNNVPHAVCIPFPVQSHIKGMRQLAQLLHHRGVHVTFVNTEFNHKRFLKSLGPNSLDGVPGFRFETIPDGLQTSDEDTQQDIMLLAEAIRKNFLAPFRDLLAKLNHTAGDAPVTHIVADGWMSAFPMEAAEEIGIPVVLFFTISACSLMGYIQFPALVEKGLVPLKDASCLTNGFLDKVIDWILGMKGIRLRDLPKDMRVTNPNDKYWKYCLEAIQRFVKGSAVVVHSFGALEKDVLDALLSLLPVVYAIGPLQLLLNQMPEHPLNTTGYSLWKEETECFKWLNSKSPNSVVYVNFGSLAFVTPEQLVEFGWGLAKSKLPFIWVIRPDLVVGESVILPPELVAETKERGLIASWCPQEQVLEHPSVGGFLTHSGWNSTVESLCAGVPMLCWPCSSDQPTNCCYACKEWGVGMEISNDVKRDEVEKLVKELMEGEKGKKMKNEVMERKKLAEAARWSTWFFICKLRQFYPQGRPQQPPAVPIPRDSGNTDQS